MARSPIGRPERVPIDDDSTPAGTRMTDEHNWLPLQVAIKAGKMLARWGAFDKATAPATTKHRHQVAGANDWHE